MSADQLPSPLNRLLEKDQSSLVLDKGSTLFVQGGETAGLYYLVSGLIDLKRTTASGHSILIHQACAQDTFAEASLFSDYYHCTATVSQASHLILCKRAAINLLFENNRQFALAMAARFAGQIQMSRRRVELLSIRSAADRILEALNDGLLFEDITTFADAIGLAPETVYRNLAKLSKAGKVIKTARGQYQLN